MREIDIGGKIFEVRSLRASELASKKMRALGYGRFALKPNLEGENTEQRLADVMDAALIVVLGEDGYQAVDAAGGVRGLSAAWQSIMAETYGSADEEKNSSGAGSGSATPGAATTAPPAES